MIVTVLTPPGVAIPHIFQRRLSVSLSLFTTYSVHCLGLVWRARSSLFLSLMMTSPWSLTAEIWTGVCLCSSTITTYMYMYMYIERSVSRV